ncbi:unnamed protein product [Pedinophyceae sp. YPF-701]|nr:unnamed protein product [Pedinophyceae sp. YPF-701]
MAPPRAAVKSAKSKASFAPAAEARPPTSGVKKHMVQLDAEEDRANIDDVNAKLDGMREALEVFLAWKDDVLRNVHLEPHTMMSLVLVSSRIYLAFHELERASLTVAHTLERGIEQGKNQELWFAGPATEVDTSGPVNQALVWWLRFAAKLRIRQGASEKIKRMGELSRKVDVLEYENRALESELNVFRAPERLANEGTLVVQEAKKASHGHSGGKGAYWEQPDLQEIAALLDELDGLGSAEDAGRDIRRRGKSMSTGGRRRSRAVSLAMGGGAEGAERSRRGSVAGAASLPDAGDGSDDGTLVPAMSMDDPEAFEEGQEADITRKKSLRKPKSSQARRGRRVTLQAAPEVFEGAPASAGGLGSDAEGAASVRPSLDPSVIEPPPLEESPKPKPRLPSPRCISEYSFKPGTLQAMNYCTYDSLLELSAKADEEHEARSSTDSEHSGPQDPPPRSKAWGACWPGSAPGWRPRRGSRGTAAGGRRRRRRTRATLRGRS